MSFVHDDPQFDDLPRVVAARRRLALALVEKDYGVKRVAIFPSPAWWTSWMSR